MSTLLEYKGYEDSWFSALPLGNGRLGAMVWGGPEKDTIEINEKSLWSGKRQKVCADMTPDDLAEIRRLFFENRFEEGEKLCREKLRTTGNRSVLFYQAFCTLSVDFLDRTPYSNYKKELSLRDAVTRVNWMRDGKSFKTESFISEKYDTFFYKASSDSPFSCAIDMTREENAYTTALMDDTLILRGQITWNEYYGRSRVIEAGEGMRFAANLKVVTDGAVKSRNKTIYVSNATYVVIISAFATNHNADIYDIDESINVVKRVEEDIAKALEAGFDKALDEHIEAWRGEYDKACMEIDAPLPTIYDMTDMRLEVMKYQSQYDPEMFATYFNYGRYLLLASSGFNATLPANLQGMWCSGNNPPWGSDYHNNINIQMNYWPCGPANVEAAFPAFFKYVKQLAENNGKEVVKKLFGARGWAAYLTSDVFGFVSTYGARESVFPTAGAWLCLNLWEHFEFTRDFDYLKELYPILKGSCEFLLDYLVEDKNGKLVTCPATSPENEFIYTDPDGNRKRATLCAGAAMDQEIVYSILTRGLWAARHFADSALVSELEEAIPRLSPLKVSERYNTLCEWNEDYEETEPGHRHISHLFGLYPADQINETDPVIYEAARRSLERRISHGSGGTGWSIAWFVNFYARLHESEKADNALWRLVKDFTTHNLFDQHPPFPLFQIDGNLGGTAGIVEMLLQSHLGDVDKRIVEVFPAFPKRWNKGKIKGIRARGGFSVDLEWNDNKLIFARFTSDTDNTLRIKETSVFEGLSSSRECTKKDGIMEISLKKGESVEFKI